MNDLNDVGLNEPGGSPAAPCSAEEVDAAILSALDALYPVAVKLEKKGGAFHLNCNERGALGAWLLLSITEPCHDIPSQNSQDHAPEGSL